MPLPSTDAARMDPQPLPQAYRSALRAPTTPPVLTEHLTADCAVIGMGITGNSAAIHLAQRNLSVIQLEAGAVSCGGSGRAFGLVVPYGKHGEARVVRDLGRDQGELYLAAMAEGPALVRSLVNAFGIKNAVHGEGWFLGPYTPQSVETLRARARFWRDRGADVDFIEGQDVVDRIGCDLYPSGLFNRRALSVNPLAYATGLAEAASGLGVAQFANTPATSIGRKGDGWVVATPQGQVTCRQVLICTNAYTGRIWPGLAANFIRIRGHQAVTEPLPENTLARILPGAAIVTDTRHTWSGLKKLPDGRLHLSAGGPSLSGDSRADLGSVKKRLAELYPWLGKVGWTEDWSGWVAITRDQYPTIKRLDEGVWAGFGYSGRGLAAATLMGRELARVVATGNVRDTFVPVDVVRPLPLAPVARVVAAGLINWYRLVDAASKRA